MAPRPTTSCCARQAARRSRIRAMRVGQEQSQRPVGAGEVSGILKAVEWADQFSTLARERFSM
eukprot:973154-Lingulodinium_polyedra.AAC.1